MDGRLNLPTAIRCNIQYNQCYSGVETPHLTTWLGFGPAEISLINILLAMEYRQLLMGIPIKLVGVMETTLQEVPLHDFFPFTFSTTTLRSISTISSPPRQLIFAYELRRGINTGGTL